MFGDHSGLDPVLVAGNRVDFPFLAGTLGVKPQPSQFTVDQALNLGTQSEALLT